MDLIILNAEQKAQVDTDVIVGIANHSPANTYRYNLDKRQHIESILGDVSEYIKSKDEIVENDPDLEI
jgi:hypothetical protein